MMQKSLFILFFGMLVSWGINQDSHANLFDTIKEKAEKTEHKVKHKIKDEEGKAEHKVKRSLKTVEKEADEVEEVSRKATGEAGHLISKLPGGKLKMCAVTGIKMAQGVEQIVADSVFPKDFCANFRKFHHAGCSLDAGGELVRILGSKIKFLKKFQSINDGRCACLEKIFNIYGHAKSQGGFNPETCSDVERVIHCCEDMMGTIPGLQTVCSTISKVAHKAESPCKKVLGTCPVLIGNIAAAIAEVVENEKEVLNNAAIVCHNIEQLDHKHCCKIAGPLTKKCNLISEFGDNVCQSLDCPIEMAQFIKEISESGGSHVDCQKLDELKGKNCGAAAKYLPGALKNIAIKLNKSFHKIEAKADAICNKVEDVEEDVESLGTHHKRKHS